MKVTTVNVNGIRAAIRKGMADWVASEAPDALLLQEVRAPEGMTGDLLPGWTVVEQACRIKGRAGVALLLRPGLEVTDVRYGLPGDGDVDTGRWVEVDLDADGVPLTLVSAYLHSGVASDEEKMGLKYAHLDRVSTRLATLGGNAIVAGDFNVVRGPADLKNFKPNHNKTSGVLDREIAYLTDWFGKAGFHDVHRELSGDVQGPYTWWSQRGKAFDNDAGWRIDYQMATSPIAGVATSAHVGRAADYASRWSDHAPVSIDYSIEKLRS